MVPHHVPRFNVTFFMGGTKIKYIDHNNSNEVVDTGLSVTAGTTTRATSWRGIVFFTNPTDGLQIAVLAKLDGAVTTSDGSITIGIDSAVILSRLSLTTDSLRIQGTDEAYNAVATSTGVLTLVSNSSQNYDDERIAIVTQGYASAPAGSKPVVWKNSLHMIGMEEGEATTNYDTPRHLVAFSDFATASTVENIVVFSSSGSEPVDSPSEVTNCLAMEGYLLIFTKTDAFSIAVGDVNTSSGARPPQFLTSIGCINEDTAAEMEGDLVWVSPDGRIMRASRAVVQNVPTLQIDNQFDAPLRELLDQIDTTQTFPLCYYWTGGKLLFVQISINGVQTTFVYDNNIGAWCPPDYNKHFSGYFEIDEDLYACDANDDTVFQVEVGTSDNGADIQCCIASGIFNAKEGLDTMQSGQIDFLAEISRSTTMYYTPVVNESDGNSKEMDSSLANFTSGRSIPLSIPFAIGGSGQGQDFGRFKYKAAIVPSYCEEIQHKWETSGDGYRMRIKTWKQRGSIFETLTTLK